MSEPRGATCPNCGAARLPGALVCAECGAMHGSYARPSSGGLPAWRIVLGVLATCGTLAMGAMGACFLMFAGAYSPSPSGPLDGPLGVGLAFAAVAVILLIAAIALFRRSG